MFSPVRHLQHPNLPHRPVNRGRSPFLRTSGMICVCLLLLIGDDSVRTRVSHTHALTPSPPLYGCPAQFDAFSIPTSPTDRSTGPIPSANFADLLCSVQFDAFSIPTSLTNWSTGAGPHSFEPLGGFTHAYCCSSVMTVSIRESVILMH